MERNNLTSIYSDSIKLLDGGASVYFTKKSNSENKIIIEHSELSFLLDFFDYVLSNYTNNEISVIKLKNRTKLVLYVIN
jgi:hypothetical protein